MPVILAIDPGVRAAGWAIFLNDPSPELHGLAKGGKPSGVASPEHQETCIQPHPPWELVETGVIIAPHRPRRIDVSSQLKAIQAELDRVEDMWRPQAVACWKPSVMQLPQQQKVLEMLGRMMDLWAQSHGLRLYSYPPREIRTSLIGRANAGKEELTYAVMTRWGLLGEEKTTHEWNAVAVGDYHLGLKEAVGDQGAANLTD